MSEGKVTIKVSPKEFNQIALLNQPAAHDDYLRILGDHRAAQILSAAFHDIPLEIEEESSKSTKA